LSRGGSDPKDEEGEDGALEHAQSEAGGDDGEVDVLLDALEVDDADLGPAEDEHDAEHDAEEEEVEAEEGRQRKLGQLLRV
jgi:hypothetical protein